MLRDGDSDAGDISFLESIRAYKGFTHLASDSNHGDGVHLCIGESGHEVGSGGARGHHAHTDAAGGAGVTFGGMSGTLFVTHQDVVDKGAVV